MENKPIHLSAEDIISLITEQSVKKEEFCISSNSSFLAIMSLLAEELSKRFKYDESANA